MTAKKGGLYWGRVSESILAKVGQWSHVVLNDSQINGPENTPPDAAAWLRARNKAQLWHSLNCLGVFVSESGAPSAYWPAQQRLHRVAEEHGGWLLKEGGIPVTQIDPWGRVRYFDLGVPAIQTALAAEMAAASDGMHGIFLDEAHRTIADIRGRHAGITRTDDEWRNGLRRTLRLYALLMNGRPLPIVTNGTFGRGDSALVSGRYWQAVGPGAVSHIVADADGAKYTMVHAFGSMMSPAEIASVAARINSSYGHETCYQWTAANGPFTSDYIPGAVEMYEAESEGDSD